MNSESSAAQRTFPGRNGGTLVPFVKGKSGNPGGLSKERRELLDAIESKYVPRVSEVLDRLLSIIANGDEMPAVAAAKLFLDHVRGPVKARDDDAIAQAVQEQLVALIQEARRRRAEQEKP
jgi:hypothetical protein